MCKYCGTGKDFVVPVKNYDYICSVIIMIIPYKVTSSVGYHL